MHVCTYVCIARYECTPAYEYVSVYARVFTSPDFACIRQIRAYVHIYMCARIGIVRNATGVAAMRFRNSTGVYRVYRAAMVAVW